MSRARHLADAAVIALLSLCVGPVAAARAWTWGSDQPLLKRCVAAEEARAAEGDEGAPPRFTARFSRRWISLDASLDGLDDKTQLPISIEEVCDVPKSLKRQAARLAGTDGLALITTHTSVWLDGKRLVGTQATTVLDGADTAILRVRLVPPPRWGEDEDGDKIPTFRARRITITD